MNPLTQKISRQMPGNKELLFLPVWQRILQSDSVGSMRPLRKSGTGHQVFF